MRLLEMKQQQASVMEARSSRQIAEAAERQSEAIMLFTIITIVFLPLGTIASIYGMNAAEFGQDGPKLKHIWKILFGISVPLATIILYLAFHRRFRRVLTLLGEYIWLKATHWFCFATLIKWEHLLETEIEDLAEKNKTLRDDKVQKIEKDSQDRRDRRNNGNSGGSAANAGNGDGGGRPGFKPSTKSSASNEDHAINGALHESPHHQEDGTASLNPPVAPTRTPTNVQQRESVTGPIKAPSSPQTQSPPLTAGTNEQNPRGTRVERERAITGLGISDTSPQQVKNDSQGGAVSSAAAGKSIGLTTETESDGASSTTGSSRKRSRTARLKDLFVRETAEVPGDPEAGGGGGAHGGG
jgi:hypothetical protein